MIKLKTLKIQGFRQFRRPTTIEFPETGLMLLEGDSGAGKSTIFEAISYALDICPFPATVLKSWTGEKLQVILTIENNGELIEIARGSDTYVRYGDSPPKTGAKALKEELVRIFGMDPVLLAPLTYRPQDELGLFLSKEDSAKKEFLAQVLGLSDIEKAIDLAEVQKKKLADELSFAQGVLLERESGLKKVLEQSIENSPPPVDEVGLQTRFDAASQVVANLESQVEEQEKKVKELYAGFQETAEIAKSAKREQLARAKEIYQTLKESNQRASETFYAKASKLKDAFSANESEIRNLNAARQEIIKLERELVSLKENKCYVCHQPFTAEAAIDQRLEKIVELTAKVQSEPVLLERRTSLTAMLKESPPPLDAREDKFAQIIGGLENELKWMGKTITDPYIVQAQKELASRNESLIKAKQDLANAKQDLHQFKQLVELKDAQRQKHERLVSDAVRQVDTQRELVAKLQTELNAEKDFTHVLGREGFLGVIFEEILGEIAAKANRFLSQLSNTSHVSVSFKTETVKGKKNIVPVFCVGDYETTRSGGLSGGMRSSADLSVDLGVISVVEQRLGTGPGWLCLDETFNGMPVNTKESALQILQQFAMDRLVIVIDHGSEFKEMFPKVLTVKSNSGTSEV